jgi:hypothetical protein
MMTPYLVLTRNDPISIREIDWEINMGDWTQQILIKATDMSTDTVKCSSVLPTILYGFRLDNSS